jgi:small subunit ribosomal protein S20
MSENQSTTKQKHSSASKYHRQSMKSNRRNSIVKSMIKTYGKKLLAAAEEKDYTKSLLNFSKVQSILFIAVKKNVIKLNKAARLASRFNKKIKDLESIN